MTVINSFMLSLIGKTHNIYIHDDKLRFIAAVHLLSLEGFRFGKRSFEANFWSYQ